MIRRLVALTLCVFSVTAVAGADDDTNETGNDDVLKQVLLELAYADLLTIESFGELRVHLVGDDAEKIGLDVDDLTDFLKLRFKNDFASFPYKDETESYFEILGNEEQAAKVGSMVVTVWVVGVDYPIAYHIEIDAGAFVGNARYKNANLGYGSKDNVPETIRKSIAGLVEDAAVVFFKTRGEL